MIIDDNGILVYEQNVTIGSEFHEKRGKPALLRELTHDPTHQINWETPYYNKFIDESLEGMDLSKMTILDLGCGDGRFTEYLVNKGAGKVICVDSHYPPLYNLLKYSEEKGFRDKITLINCGADNVPIDDNSVDIVLAMGVFYYLGDLHKDGIKNMYNKLKDNGILLSSEPNKEGLALRSLIFNGLNEMVDNFINGTFKEEQGETKYNFCLLNEKEILLLYSDFGFELQKKRGLSIFHQLIRIKHVKGEITKNELEKNLVNLRTIFNGLDVDGNFNKTILYKHVKQKDVGK